MFRNLIDPENGLMITMSQITDCIFLSLFWLMCCLPVFTIGASCAALYDAVYHGFRCHEPKCWRRFFATFLRDLKMSLIPNVLFPIATLIILSMLDVEDTVKKLRAAGTTV